jgi:hypothetical protein
MVLIDICICVSILSGIGYILYKIIVSEKDKDITRKEAEIQRKDLEIERLRKDLNLYK